jgi:hypothetical protein
VLVGPKEGLSLGAFESSKLGKEDGCMLGLVDGLADGKLEGLCEGLLEGLAEGAFVVGGGAVPTSTKHDCGWLATAPCEYGEKPSPASLSIGSISHSTCERSSPPALLTSSW